MTNGPTGSRPGHACEVCRTGFECETLNTALKVLGAHQDEIADPELKGRYEAILRKLAAGGWSYPSGGAHCSFASSPAQVRALTSELVHIWQKSHFRPKNGDESAAYQEEVRCD